MQLHRRALLTSASALALALLMPVPHRATFDTEALKELANQISTKMKCFPVLNGHFLFAYGTDKTAQEIEAEWLDKNRAIDATHRQLKSGFRQLQQEAYDEGYCVLKDGKLTLFGQHIALHLPIVPADCDKEFFALLNRLAPHYLS